MKALKTQASTESPFQLPCHKPRPLNGVILRSTKRSKYVKSTASTVLQQGSKYQEGDGGDGYKDPDKHRHPRELQDLSTYLHC